MIAADRTAGADRAAMLRRAGAADRAHSPFPVHRETEGFLPVPDRHRVRPDHGRPLGGRVNR